MQTERVTCGVQVGNKRLLVNEQFGFAYENRVRIVIPIGERSPPLEFEFVFEKDKTNSFSIEETVEGNKITQKLKNPHDSGLGVHSTGWMSFELGRKRFYYVLSFQGFGSFEYVLCNFSLYEEAQNVG